MAECRLRQSGRRQPDARAGCRTVPSTSSSSTPDYTGDITNLQANKGYAVSTLIHDFGHMLGLGHAGPYDGEVNPMTQQFGPYDMRLWTLMSYIGPGAGSGPLQLLSGDGHELGRLLARRRP